MSKYVYLYPSIAPSLGISRTSVSAVYLLPCRAEIRQFALACLGTGTTNTNAVCDRQR